MNTWLFIARLLAMLALLVLVVFAREWLTTWFDARAGVRRPSPDPQEIPPEPLQLESAPLPPDCSSRTAATPLPGERLDDLLARGAAALAAGHREEALALFERATQLAPSSSVAWSQLASAHYALVHERDTYLAADRALALDPGCGSVWRYKSWALGCFGHDQDALAAAERALALVPNDAQC